MIARKESDPWAIVADAASHHALKTKMWAEYIIGLHFSMYNYFTGSAQAADNPPVSASRREDGKGWTGQPYPC